MMSSSTVKPGAASKAGQGGFPAVAPSSQSILLEKLNVRRSTPDSEALASSDDEVESHRQENHPPLVQQQKSARRSSWLNETPQTVATGRKGSFASSSMSPTASHPSTPSAESGVGPWGSHATHATNTTVLGRGHGTGSSFPWGTGIWNNERKEPPSRLSEVLPSPTSTMVPGGSMSNPFFSGENGLTQTSPGPKDLVSVSNSQIPFAIPLHPTPKTYRSQSYSVGQMELDATAAALGSSTFGPRRTPAHSGLQHRPSRPSMLSEMANDGTMLGKVTEDDDDGDSNGSLPGNQHQSAEAKTIELLARENAILRQQQYQNSRIRTRASTGAAYNVGNGYMQESVPEESDFAIDELDESHDGPDLTGHRALGRRLSEFGSVPFRTPHHLENRKLENVKKGFWQTSLGFGGLGETPQSRRHSFADIPTRQGSISSINEAVAALEATSQDNTGVDFPTAYTDNANFPSAHQVPPYFTGVSGLPTALSTQVYGNQFQSPYAAGQTYANRPSSPHRNMYGMGQPRHNQTLHIVLFKCARADVFYVQEGTGLTVKPGDLVIVEADRGTDLGTVAKDNVDWATAKELKEHYAEEQYKWLMMYSQNAAAAQEGAGAGLMAGSNGLHGSAVGGMGPPSQHHMQEPNSGELKPKLIKRLAQSHEIHALRDKEGNEAKAKRVCMQKVKEHGLNMEILDAEFQMDWKKLTFYYFADSYINFNSLVTDLFKIYKTRIWMSAINPASFASPTLGLQAPSGIGPGAVGVNRGTAGSERRQTQQQQQQQQQQDSQPAFPGPNQTGRAAQSSYPHSFASDRGVPPAATYAASGYSYNPYGAFGNARAGGMPFTSGMVDGFPGGYAAPTVAGRFPAPQTTSAQHEQGLAPMASQSDWVGAFQGLSLNSR